MKTFPDKEKPPDFLLLSCIVHRKSQNTPQSSMVSSEFMTGLHTSSPGPSLPCSRSPVHPHSASICAQFLTSAPSPTVVATVSPNSSTEQFSLCLSLSPEVGAWTEVDFTQTGSGCPGCLHIGWFPSRRDTFTGNISCKRETWGAPELFSVKFLEAISLSPSRTCPFWKAPQLESAMEQGCQVWREITQKVGGGVGKSVEASVTNITYTKEPQVSICEWECDLIQLRVRSLVIFRALQWLISSRCWSPSPLCKHHGSCLWSHRAFARTLPGITL